MESLEQALRFFPDALAEADLATGTLTSINHLFTVLTGYEPSDLEAGLAGLDLFDHQSRMRVVAKIQGEVTAAAPGAYQRTGRQEFVPVRVRRKDGSWFDGAVHGSYILGELERPTGLRFVMRDVSDNASLQRQLDVSHARWEALRELSPVGIFHMARDGRFTEVNRQLTALTSMGVEELLGYGYMQAIHPDDLPQAAASIQGALKSPDTERVFRLECRLRFPANETRWVRVESIGQRDGEGDFAGFLGAVTDITAEKVAGAEAAASLKATDELLEHILANTPAAIAVLDAEGRFVRVNPAACQVTGYAAEELLAMSVADIAVDSSADFEQLVPLIVSGAAVQGAMGRIVRRDGAVRIGEISFAPVSPHDGAQFTVVTFLDLTDRIAAEARLAQAGRMESLGMLAGGIAHDFNNLLTVITGCAALARAAAATGQPLTEELEHIESAASRAAALVRNLLTFTRREEVRPSVFDLNAAVIALRPMIERLLTPAIELVVLESETPCSVLMDPGQFDQVLVNLAANARDAMPWGGCLTIGTSRRAVAGGKAESVVLTVTDTGAGMDEPTRLRLFEPFFTTKGLGHGTGLGLATSYGIVQQASGEITVASAPGAGATFTITFPYAGEG